MELVRDGVSLNHNEKEEAAASYDASQNHVAQHTLVLQPAYLTGAEGDLFQTSFEQALKNASMILVDLIWLDGIDESGLSVLLSAMKSAHAVGTTLSFLSMDTATRQWLDAQWEQEHAAMSIGRDDVFAPDFEQFLADYQARKEATLLAVEIASTRQW